MATYRSLPEVEIINQANNSTNIIVEQNGELNRLNINNLKNNTIQVTSQSPASGDIYQWSIAINESIYDSNGRQNKMHTGSDFTNIYSSIKDINNNTTMSYKVNGQTSATNTLIYIYQQGLNNYEELFFPLFNFYITNNRKLSNTQEPT